MLCAVDVVTINDHFCNTQYETDEGHVRRFETGVRVCACVLTVASSLQKYYYNKLDASTTWERPPDPDSADLNAPLKITQQEAAAAPGLAMAVAANSAGAGPQSVAGERMVWNNVDACLVSTLISFWRRSCFNLSCLGTFAVKKTTSTSSSSG
jgi:hypothetical protein